MSDDLRAAKSAIAKLHQDMEAISRLAKPSYLGVIEQMGRTLEPPLCQHCCRCAKKAKWQDATEPCCTSDEGRPLGVADQAETPNRPEQHS